MENPKTIKELYKQMTFKLYKEIKEINNLENWKELKIFFDENPGAIARANYAIFDDINNDFKKETLENILPIEKSEIKLLKWLSSSYLEIFSSFDENDYNYKKSKFTADILICILNYDKTIAETFFNLYRKKDETWQSCFRRIIFFLEEIVDEENKFNDNKEYYLKIIYKFNRFRKLLEKHAPTKEIVEEFNKKGFEWEENEEIEFNKFLQLEHSKMLKKLIKNDEIFGKKIENIIHPATRTMIYDKFLRYKVGDVNSNSDELRISIAILINILINKMNAINILKYKINNEENPNKSKIELLEAFEEKAKWIKIKIFSSEKINSLKNICLIIRFFLLSIPAINKNILNINSSLKDLFTIKSEKELLKNIIKLEDLLKWKGFECENKKEQKIALIEQRAFLIDEHKDFINEEWKNAFSKNCIIPGVKTRLQQLVPKLKMFSIVLKMLKVTRKGEGF
uniref:Uncharacterized protein n=1 Tax=Meloidogyne hapla TaxID=6305 RepID=A0A1I8BLG4_MELHA